MFHHVGMKLVKLGRKQLRKKFHLAVCSEAVCRRYSVKKGISSNVNEVIKTILSQCFFFTKRYCTHKNTHKQKSTNKTKIN